MMKMTEVPPTEFSPQFLDVPALLERSMPLARRGWFWYASGAFLLIVLLSAWANAKSPDLAALVNILSGVMMIGLVAGMSLITFFAVRKHQAEQLQLQAIEELVTLRRWPQAAMLLEGMLQQPTRTPGGRFQALIFLAGVLGRYHRFTDAIAVYNHLLENVVMDPASEFGLRMGRTMSMLREDHLFDADRAIADLRKRASRATRAAESQSDTAESSEPIDIAPPAPASAGLALIEIYRDVKTGHPDEAIKLFESALPVLRRQLGHRVADGYALAARAYDLLDRPADAQDAYEKATLLSPLVELSRRYPEVASLATKYRAAIAPAEAA